MAHHSASHKQQLEESKWYDSLWLWIIIILVVQLVYWFSVIGYFHWCHQTADTNQNWANAGTFGDLFGGLSCLFSGLAFAGLIVTIRQQSREIKLQIKEQQDTRAEFEEQTKQFVIQNQQARERQIVEDIYNRISLIKQLEREIEIHIHSNDGNNKLTGAHAICKLGELLEKITNVLFPDEEQENYVANITNITNVCLLYCVSFQYLDAWLNHISLLLTDIDKSFDDLGIEYNHLKNKYWKIVIKSSNIFAASLLYANHDTYLDYPVIEKLRKEGVIEDRFISRGIAHMEKRKLLYEILNRFPADDADDVVCEVGNQWRKYKGWQPCFLIKKRADDAPYNFTCGLDNLRNDPYVMQQLRDEVKETSKN